MDDDLFWIWLTLLRGVGPRAQHELLARFKTPCGVYEADMIDLVSVTGIGESKARLIAEERVQARARAVCNRCSELGIDILTPDKPLFPQSFCNGSSLPLVLYARGSVDRPISGVGIVGARRCSREDRDNAARLASQFVMRGDCVISGMAKGVDSYAHTACILADGFTIAVLGCGVDLCYPPEHGLLMQRIIEQGLVISEYPPATPPVRYHFPKRNRLIAALCTDLYVVGAQKGSGALITAQYAVQFGKKVHYVNA